MRRSPGVLPDGTYGYTSDLAVDIPKYCEPGDPFYNPAATSSKPFKVEMDVKGDQIRQYDYFTGSRKLGPAVGSVLAGRRGTVPLLVHPAPGRRSAGLASATWFSVTRARSLVLHRCSTAIRTCPTRPADAHGGPSARRRRRARSAVAEGGIGSR